MTVIPECFYRGSRKTPGFPLTACGNDGYREYNMAIVSHFARGSKQGNFPGSIRKGIIIMICRMRPGKH
jgi:hypothetical protein